MRVAVIALTKNGSELALKIGPLIHADLWIKQEFMGGETAGASVNAIEGSFPAFVGGLFHRYDALVFIMACGIVVRAVAPYIKDKKTDPAVVVVDEKGQYAISLLSGHTGGANRLARELAAKTGGTPVITTATDVNGFVAFDVFAVENDCAVENPGELKYISAELVNGGRVGLYSGYRLEGLPENIVPGGEGLKYMVVLSNRAGIDVPGERVLYLRPRNLILGIGCRKGISKEQIRGAVNDFMLRNGRSMLSLKCAATIDLKKDEKGLQEFCREWGLELRIVLREDIEKVENRFTCSGFVKEKVGVASVAEPCAVMAGKNTRLICKKTVYPGITLALAEEEKEFYL